MEHDKPFDRRLRRLRRDRAALRFADANYLHRHAGLELLDRLDLVTRRFTDSLDLGCADGFLTEQLRARGLNVVPADFGRRFATAAGGIQCEEDRLPFADESFDLVLSVGVLDTVNDLPGALTLIRRILRPDGLFMAAFAGAGSLPRLRSAVAAAEEAEGRPAAPRLHPQIDVRAAGDLLTRAGFTLPVVDSEMLTVRFHSFAQPTRDLRAMGGTNILQARARQPIGRLGAGAAMARFADAAEEDGKIAEQFEIIYMTAWAPAPSQPQPARRGSATASLADALRPRT